MLLANNLGLAALYQIYRRVLPDLSLPKTPPQESNLICGEAREAQIFCLVYSSIIAGDILPQYIDNVF